MSERLNFEQAYAQSLAYRVQTPSGPQTGTAETNEKLTSHLEEVRNFILSTTDEEIWQRYGELNDGDNPFEHDEARDQLDGIIWDMIYVDPTRAINFYTQSLSDPDVQVDFKQTCVIGIPYIMECDLEHGTSLQFQALESDDEQVVRLAFENLAECPELYNKTIAEKMWNDENIRKKANFHGFILKDPNTDDNPDRVINNVEQQALIDKINAFESCSLLDEIKTEALPQHRNIQTVAEELNISSEEEVALVSTMLEASFAISKNRQVSIAKQRATHYDDGREDFNVKTWQVATFTVLVPTGEALYGLYRSYELEELDGTLLPPACETRLYKKSANESEWIAQPDAKDDLKQERLEIDEEARQSGVFISADNPLLAARGYSQESAAIMQAFTREIEQLENLIGEYGTRFTPKTLEKVMAALKECNLSTKISREQRD